MPLSAAMLVTKFFDDYGLQPKKRVWFILNLSALDRETQITVTSIMSEKLACYDTRLMSLDFDSDSPEWAGLRPSETTNERGWSQTVT